MLSYKGGKLDDTTVVLAKMKKLEPVKIVTNETKTQQKPKGDGV